MILGSYRRIMKQDYSPNNQKDIDTLSITVNDSFESIYNAFKNQITFADNINCTITTITTSVNSSSVPQSPLIIKLASYQKKINGILVMNVVASDGVSGPTGGVYLNYAINNNSTSSSNTTNSGNQAGNPLTITVNKILGLPAGKVFEITILII